MKSFIIGLFAKYIRSQVLKDSKNAIVDQKKVLNQLVQKASSTQFGKDHHFNTIKNYEDFKSNVPIRDYEGLKNYVEEIKNGKTDVLWPGRPKYFAKTSGTTSGVKFIPITADSIPNHINSARNALLNNIALSGDHSIFGGKMIFVSGSPALSEMGDIKVGRLSGIVNHEIPFWAQSNKLPEYATNCIEDWPEKVEAITKETHNQDMRLISGIPPWIQMYYESLLAHTNASSIGELFPNFKLFIYGGVNYQPYKTALQQLVKLNINTLETYPASEGFFAFQDQLENNGLLLNTNSGIFYEFIPLNKINEGGSNRLSLEEVKIGVDYAIIISNNAGLWAYNIGDTVRFVSLNPYRLVVSGRIKHYISAFGEHVIAKEVDQAIAYALETAGGEVAEYTVAPQVNPTDNELPYHEWLIEFSKAPEDMSLFKNCIHHSMIAQNIYYKDLMVGEVLQKAKITALSKGSFQRYMESIGKLGGQNKVPRLSNDRKIADQLMGK